MQEKESIQNHEQIQVIGARVHNLKNIDVNIPRDALTVITGLSGSGKSSLAFDTLFAEGQRRYIETFSAYARNLLGNLERPDVDKISGLSPVISIEQKTTNRNPRSTVGTTTEIFDFLRLLFARAGQPFSYNTMQPMVKYTEEQVLELILKDFPGKRMLLLAPLVTSRKGHYRELFEYVRKKGYPTVRVDGELREIIHGMKLDRYKKHDIEVVIDKLIVDEKEEKRIAMSLKEAMKMGDSMVTLYDIKEETSKHYSKRLMCPTTGISYSDPAPHNFSFNSPKGACPKCKGLGYVNVVDIDLVIPDRSLSVQQGAIVPIGKGKTGWIKEQIGALLENYGYSIATPLKNLDEEVIEEIMNGSNERIRMKNPYSQEYVMTEFEGVIKFIQEIGNSEVSASMKRWVEKFQKTTVCPVCKGQRLNKESLHYIIADKNIMDLAQMDISHLAEFLSTIEEKMSSRQRTIATEILKEIRTRLQFLLDVGLDYLTLDRTSISLSGGESQRIRLATQIGSQLVNVLYILDEPSIGLHQRDNVRLIKSLKKLRDIGNSVIVVEHDRDMMLEADYIIDLGPKAGRYGGELVYAGVPKDMLKQDTLTSQYLNGKRFIEMPPFRSKGNGLSIDLFGATGNNLKNVDVSFPLGTLTCITGVSGSGKSTLINETLQPILSQYFFRSLKDPLNYERIEGLDNINKVVNVDQSPLGRTPRSNPATYTGLFGDIRSLYVGLPEAKIRGYKPGRFSFNVKGGRCEECKGNGYKVIEMNFLPDVYAPCEVCHGKRYNRATLEVRYKGKSIADVLDMTINQASDFFQSVPQILHKVNMLKTVGLGYIRLGQSSTTLSGGESQRVKLATELAKKDTGSTLYILDEPTTGLHFEDIRLLMNLLRELVNRGNTVLVIEHNLDVIRISDYIIDVGPEGGQQGGYIIATGTPEEICTVKESYTAKFLKDELKHFPPVPLETTIQNQERMEKEMADQKDRNAAIRALKKR